MVTGSMLWLTDVCIVLQTTHAFPFSSMPALTIALGT